MPHPEKKRERRYDSFGPIILMAEVEGWCMVRRPRCTPFVISREAWRGLSTKPLGE